MKTFFLFLLLTAAASAQTMRDSTYTVDSTATAITITIDLTAKQAAGCYRAFGVDWIAELKSTIRAIIAGRDPFSVYKDEYDAIQGTTLTAAQKKAALDALAIPNPRVVQVVKRVSVPAVMK